MENLFKSQKYSFKDGIYDFNIDDSVTKIIKKFYEDTPFPNYKNTDDKASLLEIGNKNFFMKNLKKFIGNNKKILEIGAGTCQFSNYLAIGSNNEIVSFDSSFESLKLGSEFAKKNNLNNVKFVRGDIFDEIFSEEVFDYVITNGVLHHTGNAKKAFYKACLPLKKDGHIFVGLYNRYGRIRTIIRKYLYKLLGKKILFLLDPVLRKIPKNSIGKINAWIKDQYLHPIESLHTFDEVLEWFNKNNIEFISSIPKCNPYEIVDEEPFLKQSQATNSERIFSQLIMIFNHFGAEGGLFIFTGKKLNKF
jgi:2-polyprenyl-3-methyl-5-hydroxy-6-metoxy-1,4-benzoquinol methylase|tara:strand:+ start:852 stop:1769 length:918 start_codon:yes stop_codon:yes gene_type:complete